MTQSFMNAIRDYALEIILGLIALFCAFDMMRAGRGQAGDHMRRWPTHWGLYFVILVLHSMLPLSAVIAAAYASKAGFGLVPALGLPVWLGIIIWIAASSLMQYTTHYASHIVPFLWAFHRVHHSDDIMDSSTGLRHHPIEFIWVSAVNAALAALIAPDPLWIGAWMLVEFVVALATHATWRMPENLSRTIEFLLVTPRIHGVHHSDFAPQTDSNYGAIFTVWDRLFGTLVIAEPESYGLQDFKGERARDFGWLLVAPITFLWQKTRASLPAKDQQH